MATTTANPDLVAPQTDVSDAQVPVTKVRADQQVLSQAKDSSLSTLPSVREVLEQPAVRRSMPAIIALLTVAMFVIAYFWMQESPYRAVYPGLSEADRQAAYEALSGADFRARIDVKTGELNVPSSRYHEARIYLASKGLPQGGAREGISALSSDASMVTSQFMEQVRYISAMEQELARSVEQISTIKSARVHLASPKQSVFVRNRTQAKASVVVSPYPGRLVSPSQVQAIVHMIASSIPHLASQDVAVVDQRGKLLTDANRFNSMQLNSVQMEYKHRVEETYRNRIDALLTPVVGEGNVRSEVDVKMDFTEIESTYEGYDKNNRGPLARSETLSLEKGAASSAEGIPGAMSNTAPLDTTSVVSGQVTASEAQDSQGILSSTTTRNYEIDREVRHVKRHGGELERISVAVVINELAATPNAEPNEGAQESAQTLTAEGFSASQLERFTNLVKGAIGFDAERGDLVTIVSARFESPVVIDNQLAWYENAQLISAMKSFVAALVFIALLFVVVRPVIRLYLPDAQVADDAAMLVKDGELTQAELEMIEMGDDESLEDIKAKLKPKKSTISADMLDTANTYDDKVALIRLLVAEDSGRVANVLKKMIQPV